MNNSKTGFQMFLKNISNMIFQVFISIKIYLFMWLFDFKLYNKKLVNADFQPSVSTYKIINSFLFFHVLRPRMGTEKFCWSDSLDKRYKSQFIDLDISSLQMFLNANYYPLNLS